MPEVTVSLNRWELAVLLESLGMVDWQAFGELNGPKAAASARAKIAEALRRMEQPHA